MTNVKVWLDCECQHPGHSIQVALDREDKRSPPTITVTTLVPVSSFWVRAKNAIRYIFKGTSIVVNEAYLDDKAVERLAKLIVVYKFLKGIRDRESQEDTANG